MSVGRRPHKSTARTPGRWLGGAALVMRSAGRRVRRLTARLERRGGILQLSPAGEVSYSSPRGRGGYTVHDGTPPRLGQAGHTTINVHHSVFFLYCFAYVVK